MIYPKIGVMNDNSVINPDSREYGRHEIVTAAQTWILVNTSLKGAQLISDSLVCPVPPEMVLDRNSVAAARLQVKTSLDMLNGLAQLTGLDEPEEASKSPIELDGEYIATQTSITPARAWESIERAGHDLLENVSKTTEFDTDPLDEELISEVESILKSALTFLHSIKVRRAAAEAN